jgi:hypothetical protein
VVTYLFPFLLQATPTDPCGVEAAKQYVASCTESASPDVVSNIRKIKPGTLTPARHPLPSGLLVPYVDVSPSETDVAFPTKGLSANDISLYGREQVDMACRLLSRFRASSALRRGGLADQVVRIYLETRYSEDINKIRCIGLGYVTPIDLIDMLSLYLVDPPLVVRQVSFDMSTDPGTDRLYNGGLCIELEVQSQEPVVARPLIFVPVVPPPMPSSIGERPSTQLPPPSAKRPMPDLPPPVIYIEDEDGNKVEAEPTLKKQRTNDATNATEPLPAPPLVPPPAAPEPAAVPIEPASVIPAWGSKALEFVAGLVMH